MITLPAIDVERLVADRRDLHAHPELAFQEFRTSALVSKRLTELGYRVRNEVGRTGVLGVGGQDGGPTVLLRADMDALPVHEANDVPYRSTVDGAMHACGHDGHVAVGLAVAERLAHADLAGTIKFAFQPAEEGGNGAQSMIDDGAMEDPSVDAAFGMHLWSYMPTGKVGITAGPVFASADEFHIVVEGRGGHAAVPHIATDPVVVAAHIVTMLQSMVTRRRNPFEEAVVSVTSIHAGTAFNIIPDTATLAGTVRTFGGEFYDRVPDLMQEVASGVARSLGAEARVNYTRLIPPAVNDAEMAGLMSDVAAEVVGTDNVLHDVRTMGGEDMAYFLERAPGCYAFVGCANAAKGVTHPHHSPHFNIDEDALTIAAELLSRTAIAFLQQHTGRST